MDDVKSKGYDCDRVRIRSDVKFIHTVLALTPVLTLINVRDQ